MRTTIRTMVLAALLTLGVSGVAWAQQSEPEQVDDVGVFYDSLSPYGDWVNTEEYGMVWKPVGVSSDWRPYTYGRWTWTEEGWYWTSYYEWGWAPFHYGRWAVYNDYGWVWIPGTVWAPAWVEWRYSDAYIGWYPLWPEFVVVAGAWYEYPHYYHRDHWVFCEAGHFADRDLRRHYLPGDRAGQAYGSTTESHEYHGHGADTHLAGPPQGQIEKASGTKIPPARLADTSRPVPVSQLKKAGGSIPADRPNFAQNAQVMLPKTTAAKLPEAARASVGTPRPLSSYTAPGRGGAYRGAAGGVGQNGPRYHAPLGSGSATRPGYQRPYGSTGYRGAPRSYDEGRYHAPGMAPGGMHRPAAPEGEGESSAPAPVKPRFKGKEKKGP